MPAGTTYEPIATTTLSTATSSVTFSSISGSYTDLVVVVNSSQETTGTYSSYIQLNGDTGNNYSRIMLYGTGSAAGSALQSNNPSLYLGTWNAAQSSTDRQVLIINFNNYSNTTTYKTMLGRYNVAGVEVGAGVGTWRNTAAITSINLASGSGANNFASGSTFTLYGIKAA